MTATLARSAAIAAAVALILGGAAAANAHSLDATYQSRLTLAV